MLSIASDGEQWSQGTEVVTVLKHMWESLVQSLACCMLAVDLLVDSAWEEKLLLDIADLVLHQISLLGFCFDISPPSHGMLRLFPNRLVWICSHQAIYRLVAFAGIIDLSASRNSISSSELDV